MTVTPPAEGSKEPVQPDEPGQSDQPDQPGHPSTSADRENPGARDDGGESSGTGDDPADGSARTCTRTGLRLVRAAGRVTYRVANNSYGPVAPKPRNLTYDDVEEWARWDSAGGRTIYSADTPTFAYLEVLAYVTPSEGLSQMPVSKAFPDSEEPDDQPKQPSAAWSTSGKGSEPTMLDRIEQEWKDRFGQFGIRKNPQRWREVRSLFPITLPTSGWFIDISHSDTVSALNRSGPPLDGPVHPTQRVTLANLLDENRAWTCRVATMLRQAILDDGSYAHGISYRSKHGVEGGCWAFWLRQIDDGHTPSEEHVTAGTGIAITAPNRNPDLKAATDILGIRQF